MDASKQSARAHACHFIKQEKTVFSHGGLIRPLTGDGAERGEAERRRYRPEAGGNTSRSTAAGRWKLFFPVEKGSETLVGICAGRSAAAWAKGFDAPEKAGSVRAQTSCEINELPLSSGALNRTMVTGNE